MSLTPEQLDAIERAAQAINPELNATVVIEAADTIGVLVAELRAAWVERDALAAELQKNAMLYLSRDSECMVLYDEKVEAERERDALRTALGEAGESLDWAQTEIVAARQSLVEHGCTDDCLKNCDRASHNARLARDRALAAAGRVEDSGRL